jgi:glycosyltransferase involved in cell wall biosynthesis
MCTTEKMIGFINWYTNICLPLLLNNPLILTDASYCGTSDSKLDSKQLVKLWGKPYYPHLPFVLERLNKAYFILNKPKTLILYTFHKYTQYVKYFIDNAIINNPNYTFMIIINDPIIKINVPNNVIVLNRENIGYDFGAWSYGLLKDDYYKQFDRFLFINSSVIGPFTYNLSTWPEMFFNKLNNDVKLCGISINTWGAYGNDVRNNLNLYSHVQSMVFCMERELLEILIINKIFTVDLFCTSLKDTILNREVNMSRITIESKKNIGCLMDIYKNIDFRNLPNNFPNIGCILEPKKWIKYFKKPQDCIFVKTNRGDESIEWLKKYNINIPNLKTIFLISHENTHTGAPIALINLQKYLENYKFETYLLYMNDLLNINIIEYIKKKCFDLNTDPIIICNTIVTYKFVEILYTSKFEVYWYIHEWLEDKYINNYDCYKNNISLLNKYPIKCIFPCKKAYENHKFYIPSLKNELIINNGYNLKKIEDKKNENIEFNKSNNIIISIIGTIDERKNQQSFIDNIFYKCKDKFKNIILLLVGFEHKKLEIDKKYNDSIILIGDVKNAIPYINISDIVVSYSKNEVQPLNIIESMYCSKPVISTNVGGISEMIINNESGYLIEINNHTKCYDILSELILDSELRIRIGKNANKIFYEKFNEEVAFKPLLDKFSGIYINKQL